LKKTSLIPGVRKAEKKSESLGRAEKPGINYYGAFGANCP
jgi:hypothetical protein